MLRAAKVTTDFSRLSCRLASLRRQLDLGLLLTMALRCGLPGLRALRTCRASAASGCWQAATPRRRAHTVLLGGIREKQNEQQRRVAAI